MKISDLVIQPRPPEGRGEGPPTARPAAAPAAWEQGRLFQGRVISAGADGRVVLELAGERVSARSSVPLSPGKEFWFEVRRGGAEPQLTLADKKGAMYRFLQQAAGGLGDLSRLGQLAALLKTAGVAPSASEPSALLARLALGGEPAPEKIIQLASLLRPGGPGDSGGRPGAPGSAAGQQPGAGLSPPAASGQPGNLPGNLMEQLQHTLALLRQSMPGGGGDKEMLASLARAGGVLEAMAGLNEQPPAPQQNPFWLLPCFFGLDAGAGSWLLSRDTGADEDGQKSLSLAFFLEMSRLGELQLQVRVEGERLEGDFFLTDSDAADFLRGRLGELRDRLADLGYQANFRCRVSKFTLLPALKEALEKTTGSDPRRLIDIKA